MVPACAATAAATATATVWEQPDATKLCFMALDNLNVRTLTLPPFTAVVVIVVLASFGNIVAVLEVAEVAGAGTIPACDEDSDAPAGAVIAVDGEDDDE